MIDEKIFMLCGSTTEDEALKLNDLSFQSNIKFDGTRIIAVVIDKDVILLNRRGKICNLHFQEIVEDLKGLNNCIIDGEIISAEDDFTRLMKRAMTKNPSKIRELQKEVPIKYMVFDMIKDGDKDIRDKPLHERVKFLTALFTQKQFKFTEMAEYKPIKEMLEKAKKENREGIIVKDMTACYESRRSDSWRKLKFFEEAKIKVVRYKINNAGIRAEDIDKNAVQIQGSQSQEVKELIDKNGEVEIYIQYLEKTENNRYRFPSYRGLVEKEAKNEN